MTRYCSFVYETKTLTDQKVKVFSSNFFQISSDDDLPLGADFHSLQPVKALEKENGGQGY